MEKSVAKYLEIADWLRSNILDGTFRADEKLITEYSLCEKFNVSRHTARSAIAVLEREGLVLRRQGDGTYINVNTNSAQKNIGVLLTTPNCYIFPLMLSGMSEVFSSNGHRIILALSQNKVEIERAQLLSLQAANIDGLIVEAVQSSFANPSLKIYKDLRSQNIPIVFVNTYYPRLDGCNYIVNNDLEGSRLATGYLIDCGHRKIGGIFKLDSIQGFQRYEGFVNKLYEQNLTLDESRIFWYSDESEDRFFSSEQFSLVAEAITDCTAILCYSDRIAHKLIKAVSKLNVRIPEDLSIIGFDNSIISEMSTPSITSISHPGIEMGKLAANSLLKMMKDNNHTIHLAYTPTLTIRNSVNER